MGLASFYYNTWSAGLSSCKRRHRPLIHEGYQIELRTSQKSFPMSMIMELPTVKPLQQRM
uniref:Uncharacterized protein n=1 Tax=Salix viminalis TaxID=40686 RepID=A0A6N2LH30_SALVM